MSVIENLGALNFIDPSGFAPTTRAAAVAAAGEDQVQIASVPLTTEVEQPNVVPSLNTVLDSAIRQLRAAASESTNAIETAYLSGLADRFQRLEETGISAPSPLAAKSGA